MTADDLDRIEARLGVSLPAEYRKLMTQFPTELTPFADNQLTRRAEFVINETTRKRLGELIEVRWPWDYVVIGHNGCGDYYCLDLGQSPSPIMCFDHETGRFDYIAASVNRFCDRLMRQY